ncbi:hypothetical protein E1H18_2558 [Caulobacter sp. RHG1]|nr:hypothetical protein [Caulobacter sp. RHG1]
MALAWKAELEKKNAPAALAAGAKVRSLMPPPGGDRFRHGSRGAGRSLFAMRVKYATSKLLVKRLYA